ncbi:MAG: transcription antitermination factor NusB [Candidatus Limnocylindrales bacterium]
MAEQTRRSRAPRGRQAEREGRRLALVSIFEADFGQRTAVSALARQLQDTEAPSATAELATAIVRAVVARRDSIDATIERLAPAYPVVGLARIDRSLLRSALGEVLHCPATPVRVAVAEWVEMARTYSGEPARRLLNGVLGRVADDVAETGREAIPADD